MQFAKGILRLTNRICDQFNISLGNCNIDHKFFLEEHQISCQPFKLSPFESCRDGIFDCHPARVRISAFGALAFRPAFGRLFSRIL